MKLWIVFIIIISLYSKCFSIVVTPDGVVGTVTEDQAILVVVCNYFRVEFVSLQALYYSEIITADVVFESTRPWVLRTCSTTIYRYRQKGSLNRGILLHATWYALVLIIIVMLLTCVVQALIVIFNVFWMEVYLVAICLCNTHAFEKAANHLMLLSRMEENVVKKF